MKKIYLILLVVATNLCTSQTTYSLVDDGISLKENTYSKDTYGDFDKFIGTWKYQSGNIVFEITLQKRVMIYNQKFNNFSDMIIGEYRYTDLNGVNLINTMANLNFNLEPYKNSIAGEHIMGKSFPVSERKVKLNFSDPDRKYLKRYITIKHHASQGNTPETIEIEFTGETSIVPDDNSPTELRVPEQNYTLTKVQ